jgi:hypothetical protein
MEEKSRESRVGKHTIFLGDDDTFYVTIIGGIDEEMAAEIKNAIIELNDRFGRKRRDVVVDSNEAGQASSKARRMFRELTELETTGNIAIFGLHPVARVLASFFIGGAAGASTRFFKTKEECLAWLKGKGK